MGFRFKLLHNIVAIASGFGLLVAGFWGARVAWADGEPGEGKKCSIFEAEYVPSSDYKIGDPPLNYKITVEKNEDYIPSQFGTRMFFVLDTFDAAQGRHLSTFRIPYNCAGGAIPTCILEPFDHPSYKLYIAGLTKEFTSASLQGEAPYTLVIPNAVSVFYRLPWEKIEAIRYHTGDKDSLFNRTHRPVFVPSVWVLKGCDNSGQN